MNDMTAIGLADDPIGTGANKIAETCWVPGMPNEVYHGDCCVGPSLSTSGMKQILHDPAEYWRTSALNPDRAEREVKFMFNVGTTAHTLALEPELIDETISVVPRDILASNGALSTKAAKEFVADQTQAGRTVITPDQWDAVCSMADNMRANPIVMRALEDVVIEPSLFVRSEATGLYIKSRPDAAPKQDGRFIVDLKTTDLESIEKWEKAASVDLRYDIQGAVAMNHVKETMGVSAGGVMYVVACKKDPYRVGIRLIRPSSEVGHSMLSSAWIEAGKACRIFAQCYENNDWPSPWDSVSDIQPPEFRMRQMDKIISSADYPQTPFSDWGQSRTW